MQKVWVPDLITLLDHRHRIFAGRGGMPGPFDKNTPSGFIERMSSAEVVAGTTVILQPTPASSRRILRFDAVVDDNHVELGRGRRPKPFSQTHGVSSR